jgi:hypothetical protein
MRSRVPKRLVVETCCSCIGGAGEFPQCPFQGDFSQAMLASCIIRGDGIPRKLLHFELWPAIQAPKTAPGRSRPLKLVASAFFARPQWRFKYELTSSDSFHRKLKNSIYLVAVDKHAYCLLSLHHHEGVINACTSDTCKLKGFAKHPVAFAFHILSVTLLP